MGYNTKNYRQQGGEKTIIGGEVVLAATSKVTIETGAIIEGLPSGSFTPAASQENSTATTIATLVVDFNALLAKLRGAGLMGS